MRRFEGGGKLWSLRLEVGLFATLGGPWMLCGQSGQQKPDDERLDYSRDKLEDIEG